MTFKDYMETESLNETNVDKISADLKKEYSKLRGSYDDYLKVKNKLNELESKLFRIQMEGGAIAAAITPETFEDRKRYETLDRELKLNAKKEAEIEKQIEKLKSDNEHLFNARDRMTRIHGVMNKVIIAGARQAGIKDPYTYYTKNRSKFELGESVEKISSYKMPAGVKPGEDKLWYVYWISKDESEEGGKKRSHIFFAKTGTQADKVADQYEETAEIIDVGLISTKDKTTIKKYLDKMPCYAAYLNESLNEAEEHLYYYYWIEGGKSNIKFFKDMVAAMRWYAKNLNGREDEIEWSHSSTAQKKDKSILKQREDKVAKLRGFLKSDIKESLFESSDNKAALAGALKSKYKGKWKFSKILRCFDAEDGTMDFVAVFNIPQDLYRGDASDDIDEIYDAAEKALKGLKIDTDEGTKPIKSVEPDYDGTSRGDPKGALGFRVNF